jgi:hypothetical protein
MRFIPTRIHGMLDYLMGALLIAAPWIFGFNRGGAETWVPVILGAGVILYSLFTDYELGAIRKLSMGTHLMMDLIGGAFLAVSPWLFGFNDFVYLPHLILGLAEMGAAVFTQREPARQPQHGKHKAHSSEHKATTSTRDHNATIVTPASRPPMGSKTDQQSRSESERSRKEREDLE